MCFGEAACVRCLHLVHFLFVEFVSCFVDLFLVAANVLGAKILNHEASGNVFCVNSQDISFAGNIFGVNIFTPVASVNVLVLLIYSFEAMSKVLGVNI